MAPIRTVTKRSGETVMYDSKKIYKAIFGANNDTGNAMAESDICAVVLQVDIILRQKSNVNVEFIQDTIEKVLMDNKFHDIAKNYILYREMHARRRKAATDLMEQYNDLLFADAKDTDLKRENANINGDAPMGVMLKLGAEGAKTYVYNYYLPKEIADAAKEGYIHYHDADFSLITFNCLQARLKNILEGGFDTGHGHLREPRTIRSASALACIALQSSQNDLFGGQSFNAWDYDLAPYVSKSYRKHFRRNMFNVINFLNKDVDQDELKDIIKAIPDRIIGSYKGKYSLQDEMYLMAVFSKHGPYERYYLDNIIETSEKDTEEETHQAMEAAVHNFNSLHSRAGGQTPFSSINYGLCTSPEGRLIIKETLNAIDAGLGNGETSIFPISVFQLKAGVNYNSDDPNYDLFRQSCEVSAKRLFPNYVNLDAPYNLQYYVKDDPDTHVSTMGCRTRTMGNINGPEISGSRGNFAFTTINLPMIALTAKQNCGDNASTDDVIKEFYKLFDKYIYMSKESLEIRYKTISHKKVKNFPFLMGQHLWLDSDKLGMEDEIAPVLKHASLSIGFCGLAECLVALIGKHHGESEEAQKLGLEIIGHLRNMTDKFTEETHMNWSTFSTPAESTAGGFAKACQNKFGKVKGVCDREYLTNSSHVPVYYQTTAAHKIDVEAPYHFLANAGHIGYVELSGDTTKNVDAFEKVVRYMHDANMGN